MYARATRSRPVLDPTDLHLDEALDYPESPFQTRQDKQVESIQAQAMTLLDLLPTGDCDRRDVNDLFMKNQSELIALFKSASPFDPTWPQRVSCFLITLITRSQRRRSTAFHALSSGENAMVGRGIFPNAYGPVLFPANEPPAFILKTALTLEADDETLNEAVVGLYALNRLRALTPNFMTIYGAYRCGKADATASTMCDPTSQDQMWYSMVETVPRAQTLSDWIRKRNPTPDELLNVITQVFLSLSIAKEQVGFAHNDLHDDNVMVRRLAQPVVFSYRVGGRVYPVPITWLATIIDFGRSRVQIRLSEAVVPFEVPPSKAEKIVHPTPRHLNTGISFEKAGFSPAVGASLNDVVVLLSALSWSAEERGRTDLMNLIAGIAAPMYGGDREMVAIAFAHYAEVQPILVPFDRDVDPATLVMGWRDLLGL